MTGTSNPFLPFNTATVSAGVVPVSVLIPPPGNSLLIQNTTGAIAFVRFGIDLTVTAALTDFPVPPGDSALLEIGNVAASASVLLSSGAGAVHLSRGEGVAMRSRELPGASLDLQFLTSVLDSRVNFTRASTASSFNASGTLISNASNVARFDYDPVLFTPRGLLIEESRTNIILQSQFAASWAATTATLTPNTVTSPDGDTTAATLTENNTNAIHIIVQSVTKAASVLTYAVSFFANSALAAACATSKSSSMMGAPPA